MVPFNVARFGEKLASLLRRDEVFAILDGAIPEATDWLAGGCYLLARALVKWLGPPARLWAVQSRTIYPMDYIAFGGHRVSAGPTPWIVTHVIAALPDGVYLDGDGAFDEQGMLDKMRRAEPAPRPYEATDLRGRRTTVSRSVEFRLGSPGRPKNGYIAETTAWPEDVKKLVAALGAEFGESPLRRWRTMA